MWICMSLSLITGKSTANVQVGGHILGDGGECSEFHRAGGQVPISSIPQPTR